MGMHALSSCSAGVIVVLLYQALCPCTCRSLSEVYLTLSSSDSSQWDVLQMVQDAPQLEALLVTGDFIALPLGMRPHNTSQVGLLRVASAQNALWHLRMQG